MKLFKRAVTFSILSTLITTSSVLAEEPKLTREQKKCNAAQSSISNMKKLIFESKYGNNEKTLKDLEVEKRQIMAEQAIYNTIANLKEDKDKFQRKLNPLEEDSFFSGSTSFPENYKAVQKEIISNQILSSIAGSINLLTSDNGQFKELVQKRKEEAKKRRILKSRNKSKKEKTQEPHVPEALTYEDIFDTCEAITKDSSANDSQIKGCRLFLSNSTFFNGITPGFTGEDFIREVTNQFFQAAEVAANDKEKLADKLVEIRENTILKNLSDSKIKQLSDNSSSLMGALGKLEILSKASLSNDFHNQNKVKDLVNTTTKNESGNEEKLNAFSSPFTLGKKADENYAKAKECVTKAAFISGDTSACKEDEHGLTAFVKDVFEYKGKDSVTNEAAQAYLTDTKLNFLKKSKELGKASNFGNFFQDEDHKAALIKLKLLGEEDSLSKALNKVCKGSGTFSSGLTVKKFEKDLSAKENLWNCMENLTKDISKIKEKNDSMAKRVGELNKEIAKLKKDEEFIGYDNLLKYSAFLANKECNNDKDTTNNVSFNKCGSEKGKEDFITMTFGKSNFLTNLTELEWELMQKGESEKFLAPMMKTCRSIASSNKEAVVISNNNVTPSNDSTTAKNENAKDTSSLLGLCEEVKRNYNSIKNKKPSKKLVQAHREYNYKYNSRTGKMDKKERASWATNIGTSAAKSALTNGLPMFLSNSQFKNNLGYSTDMAIYKKNQMYMLNNPEYMFPGSYFSGYGLTGYPTYYGAPSYYGF
jgi:hypothetical protein